MDENHAGTARAGFRVVAFLLLLVLTAAAGLRAQDSLFVRRSGSTLLLADRRFYAIGLNSYYLQNLAARGDTPHVTQVFQEAQRLGVTAIRTWGFFDSPDSTDPAVIQRSPGTFNETGLRALDVVVAKAREFSIRLIIPLVNNWEDFGGMNQYVRWYAGELPDRARKSAPVRQRIVAGAGGRSYRFYAEGSATHDDFYTQPAIMQWYKSYLSTIVNRVNTVTGLAYRDDPTILAWELANEPRSSDRSGDIVYSWLTEMSAYLKSLDPNHLVGSGEEGFDVLAAPYRDVSSYNGQGWLFNGTGGVSYSRNIAIPGIDLGSTHLYAESWHLSMSEGVTWLNDHQRIASAGGKPLLFGEVGVQEERGPVFDAAFNEMYYDGASGLLPWQFIYVGGPGSDVYSFSLESDNGACKVVQSYAAQFGRKSDGIVPAPAQTSFLNAYPNPFNQVTAVSFTLAGQSAVRLEVYDGAGRRASVLTDGVLGPGIHVALFDASRLSSGVYFIRLTAGGSIDVKKVCLAK